MVIKILYTVTSQVCVEWEAERELQVCVVSAEGLVMVESEDTISLPLPYVLTRLVTPEVSSSFTSRIEEAGRCPVWRAVKVFTLENMVSPDPGVRFSLRRLFLEQSLQLSLGILCLEFQRNRES